MPISAGRKTQLAPLGTPTRQYGTLSHGSDQTLIPSTIASLEAFGSTVVVNARPGLTGGVTRLGLHGTSKRKYAAFTFKNGALLLDGIASLEAIGSLIVSGGTLQISLAGIATAEAFGTASLSLASSISLTGIASANVFGDINVAPTGVIVANSIDDGQKLASWNANTEPDLAGYRVYVSLTSGLISGAAVYDVGLTGTPSTPSYVIANLTSGNTYYVSVTAYDASNNESGFSTEVSFVATAGVRFGTITLLGNWSVLPTGLTSAEAFGTLSAVPGDVTVIPLAKGSDETFGTHVVENVGGDQTVAGIGISSAEAFGTPTLTLGGITIDLDTSGIVTAEGVGAPTLLTTELISNVGNLASLEAVGDPLVSAGTTDVRLIQIDSDEAFGTAQFDLDMTLTGLASEEAFGGTALNVFVIVDAPGIASGEAFGDLIVIPEAVDIFPPSIASLQAFGTAILIPGELQLPVRVFTARTRTFVFPSAR